MLLLHKNQTMKNRFIKIGVYSIVLSMLFAFTLPQNIEKKVTKEIKAFFEITSFTKSPITVNNAALQQEVAPYINTQTFFKIQNKEQTIGYAYVAKAPSKTDEFDYVILFNKQLEIVKTKVLIYREDYGNEIGSKRWLKQFTGKKPGNTLRYGSNVDAISGATISASSMTKAINNTLKGIQILKENHIFK